MTTELAARVQRIKPSPTLAISAKADELIAAGKNVINLGVGEPDFDTPNFIKEAAVKAIWDGFTKYTAVDGIPLLKKAIINKFVRDNKLDYQPAQILVSCGAKHSLYNLFTALLNPDDEVIIPAPYWVSYPDMVKLADAIPIVISSTFEQQFKITPAQLEAAITPKTRLIILNSPSNPTGIAYTAEELKALSRVLLKFPHIMIACDDIYEHTLWNKKPFVNIVMVCSALYDRCIVINGASKAYAMTGWRMGYAAGPATLIAAMKKIQSQSTSNPCSIAQLALEAALNGDQNCTTFMTNAYKERHDFILSELQKMPGVQCLPSDGTFYSFPGMQKIMEKMHMKDDIEFASFLLNEAGVAVVPGSAFGTPGYIRLSYATSMGKLKDAMLRMQKAFSNL